MPVQNKPIIHARDHEPGGADPINFPVSIPGNYEAMARAWASAYWKLEETETGTWFLDELPGHHDLQASTESDLTRGIGHAPEEPEAVGIYVDGPSGTGSPGPWLQTSAIDQALGVLEDDKVGFFAVVSPDPAPPSSGQISVIAGVHDPTLSGGTPFDEIRWALILVPTEVPTTPVSWGYHVAGFVGGGGSANETLHGTTLLAHPLGMTMPGEAFDVGLNYNSSVLQLYVNGDLEASAAPGSVWGAAERTGRFVLGTINFEAGVGSDAWSNFHGGIGTAMITVGSTLTSGQMKNLHEGEPVVGSFPGEITSEQHGTIPSGDLHPEYVQEAEYTDKGDLVIGTGAGAVDELPVGTDGQVLVADDAEPTGLKWADPPSSAPTGPAGGVLSGTYPNPGFAEDMATQAELDALTPATDTAVWLPLTTVVGGVPDLVWDTGDSLIPTLTPLA